MWISGGSSDLLKKLNNSEVLWEESYTGILFRATEKQVLEALYCLNEDFQTIGVATLDNFFHLVPVDMEYLKYCFEKNNASLDDILKTGWIFECFSGFEAPWIGVNPITHRIDEANQVIFTIGWVRPPCEGCLDCGGFTVECFEQPPS